MLASCTLPFRFFREHECAGSSISAKSQKRPAEAGRLMLVDDFNDPVRARINQNRTIVHDSVTILGDTILSRHFIVGNAAGRQISANTDFTVISIRRMPLAAYIRTEARPRLVCNAARCGADRCADNRTGWAAHDGTPNSAR